MLIRVLDPGEMWYLLRGVGQLLGLHSLSHKSVHILNFNHPNARVLRLKSY